MSQTTQVSEQQKLLLMEKQVGLRMEEIIPDMEKLAKKYPLQEARSPFRNVLNVATELGSTVEVTKNFIRYQLGRSASDRSSVWGKPPHSDDGDKFAVALVQAIDDLKAEAESIITDMNAALSIELDESWLKRVHYRLMQLYLGYLTRYHVYITKGGT